MPDLQKFEKNIFYATNVSDVESDELLHKIFKSTKRFKEKKTNKRAKMY